MGTPGIYASPCQVTCDLERIEARQAKQKLRRKQIKALVRGPKTEEEKENSVRAKAIRHLIRLGNILRHGDRREMASPDHRNLLDVIGSQNSPNTTKSLSSAYSNLSSQHFNLSL